MGIAGAFLPSPFPPGGGEHQVVPWPGGEEGDALAPRRSPLSGAGGPGREGLGSLGGEEVGRTPPPLWGNPDRPEPLSARLGGARLGKEPPRNGACWKGAEGRVVLGRSGSAHARQGPLGILAPPKREEEGRGIPGCPPKTLMETRKQSEPPLPKGAAWTPPQQEQPRKTLRGWRQKSRRASAYGGRDVPPLPDGQARWARRPPPKNTRGPNSLLLPSLLSPPSWPTDNF